MGRLEKRLSTQKYWDQTAWNEEIFFLSHGAYKNPQVRLIQCMGGGGGSEVLGPDRVERGDLLLVARRIQEPAGTSVRLPREGW